MAPPLPSDPPSRLYRPRDALPGDGGEPTLNVRRNRLFGRDLNAIFWISPLFGLDGLNDYFYAVGPADVRPGRPQFAARDGYLGTEVSAGFSWGLSQQLRAFGGVQAGLWKGAANDDSPLFKENVTVTLGGGLRSSIFVSEGRVER